MAHLMHGRQQYLVRAGAALAIASLIVALAPIPTLSSSVASIHVTTVADEYGGGAACSLREAVRAANTNAPFGGCPAGNSGARDIIIVASGVYTLTLTGAGEDANATGDLDISSDITVTGAGAEQTIIAGMLDRVLHVLSGDVVVNHLTIAHGDPPNGAAGAMGATPGANGTPGGAGSDGGGIYNAGTLTLNSCTVRNNGAGRGGNGGSGAAGASGISGGAGGTGGAGSAGGRGGRGGGIYNAGTLTLNGSTVTRNSAGDGGVGGSGRSGGDGGGGIAVFGSEMGGDGGAGGAGGTGGGGGSGGGICNFGTLTVNESTISDNDAGVGGWAGSGGTGGAGGDGHDQFQSGLQEAGWGGDGGAGGNGGFGGWAGGGGGITNYGTLTIVGSRVERNSAGVLGGLGGNGGAGGRGGNGGDGTAFTPACDGKRAGSGGAGGSGRNGGGGGGGGGIYVLSGVVQISSTSIQRNSAGYGFTGGNGGRGGNAGTPGTGYEPPCTNGALGANGNGGDGGTGGSGGSGGGIHLTGVAIAQSDPQVSETEYAAVQLSVMSSAIYSNATSIGSIGGTGGSVGTGGTGGAGGVGGEGGDGGSGGGIYAVANTLHASNSTISSNHADTPGRDGGAAGGGGGVQGAGGSAGCGGGIYSGSTVELAGVTLSNNSASGVGGSGTPTGADGRGGGLYVSGGTLALGHTLIGDNASAQFGPDCMGSISSQDYNLIEKTSDCVVGGAQTNNIVGQDPMLDVLRANGARTLTQALHVGSPAIDAGANACYDASGGLLTTDQRGIGYTRPVDGDRNGTVRCDIGAFEARPSLHLPVAMRNTAG
ncbi:MAG: CSLREA domain-containing protein [Chloroflexi bacterium]|nr:CSLREA domain-containing protein [Chloroflexota bacterium]